MPVAIALTPDGSAAYLANYKDGTITPIDLHLATGTPGLPIPVGSQPQALAVTRLRFQVALDGQR